MECVQQPTSASWNLLRSRISVGNQIHCDIVKFFHLWVTYSEWESHCGLPNRPSCNLVIGWHCRLWMDSSSDLSGERVLFWFRRSPNFGPTPCTLVSLRSFPKSASCEFKRRQDLLFFLILILERLLNLL